MWKDTEVAEKRVKIRVNKRYTKKTQATNKQNRGTRTNGMKERKKETTKESTKVNTQL